MDRIPDVNNSWNELSLDDKLRWLYTHPRNEKERRDIRNLIAAEITPLLIPEGFVKCCTTFLRRYGADLLQCLSINYRGTVGLPMISLSIFHLYDVIPHWDISFIGIRTNPGIEGQSIETISGIRVDPFENSYLGFRENFDEAIAIEKELLVERILPLLNGMKTTKDYSQYVFGSKEISGPSGISVLLHMKDYVEARKLAVAYATVCQNHLKESAHEYGIPIKEVRQLIPWLSKHQTICQDIIQAIDKGDETYIEMLMNDSQSAAYDALQKYSKAFAKKYPFQKIILI